MNNARKALKQFVKGLQRPTLLTGKVVAVDADTCDVEPSDGGPTLYSVRVKTAVGTSEVGTIIWPKVGSTCIVAELDGDANKYLLASCEQVDRVLVKLVGGATVEVKNDGTIELNGSQFGGLVKVQELRQDLAKVNAFLNGLRQALSTSATLPEDGGALYKLQIAAAISGLQLPNYQTIESQITKHGSA